MITPMQLIATARSLVGTPVVHQGHNKFGVDCFGLIHLNAELSGALSHFDENANQVMRELLVWDSPKTPTTLMYEGISRACKRIPKPVAGCLILIVFPTEVHPQHIGIYTGKTLIHALRTQGRVVEHGYRAPWVKWQHSCWEMPGVDYSVGDT